VVVVLACLSFGTVVFFTLRHDGSLDQASSRPGSSPTVFPLPSEAPTAAPGNGGGDTHDGDIKQFVLERPAGARTWPKVTAEEPLDMNAAAANFAKPSDGRQVLERYGFEDGYTRRWIDAQGDYVTVRVLRFLTAGGGDNFTNSYIDANQGSGWGDPQPVPGIDTAAAFVQPKPAANGLQRSLAVGAAGDIVAIVLADQPPPAKATVPDLGLSDEFGLL
jgi:hypothetical protein